MAHLTARRWVAVAAAVTLAACGSATLPQQGATPRIELQGTPVALFDGATGKTTVLLDFLVRDASGSSLDLSTLTVNRYVDGRPVDVESVAQSTDTRLASTLTLGMVLDASYSMTTWQPPALDAMEQAVLTTEQAIRAQLPGAGTFTPLVSFFQDQYACSPTPGTPDSAVLEIPAPTRDSATKVFSAAAQMVDRLKALHDAGASGASDNYALVVFTDGADNYSWHDDSGVAAKTIGVTGGAFACAGLGSMAKDALLAKIRAFPELTVHVIGLGNQINVSELGAIANAGHGRFVSNADPRQVSSLFAQIAREFTSVRQDGITMPLQPGDYQYIEEVVTGSGVARVKFQFHAGDLRTGVRSDTITGG